MTMGRLNQLTSEQLRACLLLVDEAIEFAGPESTQVRLACSCVLGRGRAVFGPSKRPDFAAVMVQFPGRERLNRGLSQRGLHRAGEPDPWCELPALQLRRGPASYRSVEDLRGQLLPPRAGNARFRS